MSDPVEASAYCIALQPVCDRELKHVADKLLYRAGPDEDAAVITDPTRETMRAFYSAVYELGMKQLVGERMLLFTAPLDWVEQMAVFQLPSAQLVAELPLSSLQSPLDHTSLSALRGKGYRIAVEADAFELVGGLAPEQVDLIKIDLRRDDAARLKARFEGRGPRLMATFIEDQPALSAAREIGFDWYQGFVFSPPFQVRFSKRKRFSNRGVELQILAELASTEMDIDRLESALAQHPDFCVLLLKQVNTAAYARPERRVDSLRQAIVVLGQERIKALAAILLLSQNDEIKEIQIRTLLIRAAMARRVAERIRSMEPALAFTLGLFSRLDALEQMPMVEILDGIPFSSEVREVLLARAGEMGRLLDLLDAYERGEVSQLNPSVVATLNDDFVRAAAWAEKWLVKPA